MAKVLVIGGTQFIGRNTVQKLIEANHDVTIMNRGKTAPNLFPDLAQIRIDRESEKLHEVKELKQNWDAVIDLCAYYPKDVLNLTSILKGYTGRYILCSSVSAYKASSLIEPTPIIDENSPLLECTKDEATDRSMTTYGERKAECERVAMAQHTNGIPTTIIRPSVVYGPHDHTDRFAYWISKVASNKPFILPDGGLTITRKTFVLDLATAFVATVTRDEALGNAYNIADTDPLNFRDTIYWIGRHLNLKPLEYAVSLSSEELLKQDIKPWVDLPLWIPKTNLLIDTFNSRKDLDFVSTPVEKAIAISADAFLKEKRKPNAGISVSAENEILSKISEESSK